MNQPKFKRGDVVRLKSGGVKMTVNGFDQGIDLKTGAFDIYDTVQCTWQNGNQPEFRFYHADALDHVFDFPTGKKLTTEEILSLENQNFMYRFLFNAYMNNMHGMHQPLQVWQGTESPKPEVEHLQEILDHLKGEKFIEIIPNSGYGDFDDFQLTDKARELCAYTPEEKPTPVGFRTNS